MVGKSKVARNVPGLAGAKVSKDSEELPRVLVETIGKAGYGIVIIQNTPEREAAVVFATDEACNMLGYSSDEVLGRSAWDFFVPSELAEIRERYKLRQSGEQVPGYYEAVMLRKDGTSVPVEASVSVMSYRGNTATVFVCKDITEQRRMRQELDEHRRHLEELVEERTAELSKANEQLQHEIAERKQMERALQESERYFRALIENSHESIAVVNDDGIVRYVNPSAEQNMKYYPKNTQGKSIFEFIHPDDLPRVKREFEEVKTSPGATMHTEFRGRFSNGLWRYIEGTGRNLLHDPVVAGIVANFRDVTERRQAEEKLRNSERYYRSIIQNSLDAMLIAGVDGRFTYVTPSIEPVSGFKPEEVVGLDVFSRVHPEDLPGTINAYNELMRNPAASVRTELRIRHRDGSWRTIEVRARNLLDDPIVSGIVVHCRDVSEAKRAEEKLQELYRQEKDLRQQIELEMKMRVEFARTLAHELKTPLTPMLISSQVLASQLKEEPLLSLAKNVSRGASNLNGRINDLLDFASGEVGILKLRDEHLNLCQLLREVAEYISPVALSRRQSLVLELPGSLPLVRADKDRLYQIMMNLLNNALKYTSEGGRIVLRAGQKDKSLVVDVEDNGPGIDEGEQQHLFEPYHRMDVDGERMSGLGLGLALCKILVELHGGRIWFRSRVGEGSTFSFSLPLETAGQ